MTDSLTEQVQAFEKRLLAFYDPEDAKRWMRLPHPALDGRVPIGEVEVGRASEVDALIHMLETGAYT